jgi:hypothetical protein
VLTEDKGEEQGLPALEITENAFDGVRLAFRSSADSCHSLSSKFDFLDQ